jgi:hypothetical protein
LVVFRSHEPRAPLRNDPPGLPEEHFEFSVLGSHPAKPVQSIDPGGAIQMGLIRRFQADVATLDGYVCAGERNASARYLRFFFLTTFEREILRAPSERLLDPGA